MSCGTPSAGPLFQLKSMVVSCRVASGGPARAGAGVESGPQRPAVVLRRPGQLGQPVERHEVERHARGDGSQAGQQRRRADRVDVRAARAGHGPVGVGAEHGHPLHLGSVQRQQRHPPWGRVVLQQRDPLQGHVQGDGPVGRVDAGDGLHLLHVAGVQPPHLDGHPHEPADPLVNGRLRQPAVGDHPGDEFPA